METMTRKSKHDLMYSNIAKHGEMLNTLFNTGLEPVTLCKKLRRLETKAHKLALDYCNGDNGIDTESIDRYTAPILDAVNKLLKLDKEASPVFFNGDARGYALKLDSDWVSAVEANIYKDWGGYGILAPDFTVN